MRNFDTCSRGFTLRLLRDWEMDVRAAHELHLRLADKQGWSCNSAGQVDTGNERKSMNQILNDWKPETRSLIQRLTDNGAKIVAGHNGENGFKFEGDMDKFIEELIATDETSLYAEVNGKRVTLFLVLGNSPGELVCDYCHPVNDDLVEQFMVRVTDEHWDTTAGESIRRKP